LTGHLKGPDPTAKAVADSLEEAGDKLFTFTRFPDRNSRRA
jgi:hypothetical protein